MTVKRSRDAFACIHGYISEFSVVLVPVKHFTLPEGAAQPLAVYLGIDMPVGHKQIRPSVVINVDKKCAPAQELCVDSKPRKESDISKRTITVIVIKRGSLVRKVRLYDVKPAVAV